MLYRVKMLGDRVKNAMNAGENAGARGQASQGHRQPSVIVEEWEPAAVRGCHHGLHATAACGFAVLGAVVQKEDVLGGHLHLCHHGVEDGWVGLLHPHFVRQELVVEKVVDAQSLVAEKLLASLGSCLRSGLVFIPTLQILKKVRGLAGVQEAQPLSFVVTFVVCLFLCRIYLKRVRE